MKQIVFLYLALTASFGNAASAAEDDGHSRYLQMVVGSPGCGCRLGGASLYTAGVTPTPDVRRKINESTGFFVPDDSLNDEAFSGIASRYVHRMRKPQAHPDTHSLMKRGRQDIGAWYRNVFEDTNETFLVNPGLSQYGPVLEERATQEDVGAQHLHMQFLYVIMLRNPIDTALSQKKKRDKLFPNNIKPLQDYIDQWFLDMELALKNSDGKKRVFLKYDDLVGNTEEAVAKLATRIGGAVDDARVAALKDYIKPDSLHTNFTDAHDDHELKAIQQALVNQLEDLYQAQGDADILHTA